VILEKDFIDNYSAVSLAFKKAVVGHGFSPPTDKKYCSKYWLKACPNHTIN